MSTNWNVDPYSPYTPWIGNATGVNGAAWDPNNVVEYVIKGEMIVVSYKIKEWDTLVKPVKPLDKDDIKKILAGQVAEYILENKMVEFTQSKEPSTGDTIVRARCYLVPSSEVQIIREILKK
jgi:hypothetical protein